MKKVNQYINKNCEKQSSNCVIYQGPEIECIDYCENEDIGSMFHKFSLEFCPILAQFTALNTISYSCQTPVAQPTLLNLFNSLFEKDCDLQDQIGNLAAAEPVGLELDWCTPIPYLCNQTCLFDLPECCTDQTKSIPDILQQLTGRVIYDATKICDLQTQINNIFVPDPTDPYAPPQISLTCSGGYWNGFTYIPAPVGTIPMEVSIPILDKDLCKLKSIVGNAADLTAILSNDCVDSNGAPIHEYTATNALGIIKQMQDYMCIMQQQITSIALIQDECCKTDCEECMDAAFTNVITNYGTASSGTTSPTITLDALINTQVLNTCIGNDLNQNTSFFWINDGSITKVIYLVDIPTTAGATINSGSIGNTNSFNITFDLDLLGLDYTRNIIVKLKIKTSAVNPCEDETRVLVPAYQNPDVCDICKVCISDFNGIGATGNIVFNVQSNKNPTVQYQLTTENPCVNLEREQGEVLSIQVISNTSTVNLRLESDCPELGVSGFCTDTESSCDVVGLVAVQNNTNANITWNAASGATSYDIEWRTSDNLVWQSATSNTNSYTLPITECVSYEVRVRAKCQPLGPWTYTTFVFGDCNTITEYVCYKYNMGLAIGNMLTGGFDLDEQVQCILSWSIGTNNYMANAMAFPGDNLLHIRMIDNIMVQNIPCTNAVVSTDGLSNSYIYIVTNQVPPVLTFTFLQAVGANYIVDQQIGIVSTESSCPTCP